jgi:hypothetical protein
MKLKRVALIVSIIVCVFTTPALAAQMSVELAYPEVFQGDNITVNITTLTEGNESIYAASYTLYFNNTLLNATSLEKGPFLSQDGNPSNTQYPPTKIDNAAGEIKYGECKVGEVPGVTGYGALTTITFQVIGEEGVSQLNLGDLDGDLLYSPPPNYGPIPTDLNNGTCKIEQTPTSASALPTTKTTATTSMQTPIPIATPTPTATAIQTPTILSEPLSSPPSTIITTPTATASTPPSKEKPEENNDLSGFKAVFAIIGLFMALILKRKNVIK